MLFNRAALSHSPVITRMQLLRDLQAGLPGLSSWLVSSAEAHDQAKPQLKGNSITVSDAPAVVKQDLNVVPNPSEPVAMTPFRPGTQLDDLVRLHLNVNLTRASGTLCLLASAPLPPVRLDLVFPSNILPITLLFFLQASR